MGTNKGMSEGVAAGKLTSKVTFPMLKAVLDGRPKPVKSVEVAPAGRPKPVKSEVMFSIVVPDCCEPNDVLAKVSGWEVKPYPGGTPSEGPLGNRSLDTYTDGVLTKPPP